jgi:putative inorganic carbon (HCO3(-)) transporter
MRRAAYWLTLCVVFTLPWENAVNVPGVGAVSRMVGLFAGGAWLLSVIATRSIRRPAPPYVVACLLVGWNWLSVLWSINPEVSIGRSATFLQLLLMAYILWDTARTAPDVRRVLQAYVLGAWVAVISLIENYIVYGAAQYQNRFTIGTFQADDLGMVLALALPAAWYLATTPYTGAFARVLRVLNLLGGPAAVIGIVFSATRAAMVAIIPAVIFIVASVARLPRRQRIMTIGGFVAGLLALLPLVPPGTIHRLTSTSTDRSQGDFDGRKELWAQAYRTFQEHPFTGVGTGAFREESSWKVAHDVWLRMAAELGLVGFTLFALLIVTGFGYAWRQYGAQRGFALATLASLLVGATFYNLEAKKAMWLFVLFPVLAASALQAKRADRHLLVIDGVAAEADGVELQAAEAPRIAGRQAVDAGK